MKKILGIALISCSLVSCYYDKKELVYPTNACDTTGTTYTKDIAPIISSNCTSCHAASVSASSGGGITLDNFADLKTWATDNNRLLNSVLQNGEASSMPKGGAKISDCSINKIRSWINKGFPE